jgi:phosphoribosylformylglycinamidine cyclo-ligase
MVHCSGGGQTKILHFIDRLHVIKDNLFPVPPLFEMIQKSSLTPWEEMYRVFNMGHRMELFVDREDAQSIIDIASSFNLEAGVVGRCEAASSKKLTIKSGFGEFQY